MDTNKIYDFIGIGVGPFNLGLAALTDKIKELDGLFIDQSNSFNWHPGLMLPTAKMQVPFYADLVTLADPTSPFTYMNYLKSTGKLFRFAINESYFPYRSEYNAYCQWVIGQLNNLFFGHTCKHINYDKRQRLYYVTALENTTGKIKILNAGNIVIGIGSQPLMPQCATSIKHPNIFHASEYLQRKDVALMHKNITLIGSGQSAAEIFQDLLPHVNNLQSLNWYTKSDRLYAMDYSKFSLELSSPDYIRHFYHLPKHKKSRILQQQHDLYKGINFSLIDEIYEQLYLLSLNANNRLPVIRTNCKLTAIEQNSENSFTTTFHHRETEDNFTESTNVIILATGYEPTTPNFLEGIEQYINRDSEGKYAVNENYSIDDRHTIFVQNAEWHTHGFNSADLGLGPHRNAAILNALLKKEMYGVQNAGTFQDFTTNCCDRTRE